MKKKTRLCSRWHAISNPIAFTVKQREVIIMLLLHIHTTWGSHVASLVKFRPVVYEEIHVGSWTDSQKNNIPLAHPYHAGNRVGSLVNSAQGFRRRQHDGRIAK